MPTPAHHSTLDWRGALITGFGTLLLLTGCAWPVALAPGQWVVGGGGGDFPSITWTLWQVAESLPGIPPTTFDTILFPRGAALLLADLPEFILLAPVTLLAGPVIAYNLIQLAHPTIAAALTHMLARSEGLDHRSATLAGFCYGLAPVWLTAIHNGNPDVGPGYLLPLCVLLLRRAHHRPSSAVLLGLGLGLTVWINPYLGVMASLLVLIMVPRPDGSGRWKYLPIALLIGGLLGAAYVWFAQASLAAPDAMISKRGPQAIEVGRAWLRGFAWPEHDLLRDGWTTHSWYLGLSALALAALAIWAEPRARTRWLIVALVGVVLSLGTRLHVGPEPLRLAGEPIWLPGHWLERLPGLDALRLVYRYSGLSALAVALLAGHGARRLGRWSLAALPLVLVDLLVFGRGAAFVEAGPVPSDASCEHLASLPPGPILDLPSSFDERWLLAQTCHGRPIAQGINRPFANEIRRMLDKRPPEAIEALEQAGFSLLVLHDPSTAPPDQRGLIEALHKTLEDEHRILFEGDGMIVGSLLANPSTGTAHSP